MNGICFAYYLFKTFGHKGDIYIISAYNRETWKNSGGPIIQKLQNIDNGEYSYKLNSDLICNY